MQPTGDLPLPLLKGDFFCRQAQTRVPYGEHVGVVPGIGLKKDAGARTAPWSWEAGVGEGMMGVWVEGRGAAYSSETVQSQRQQHGSLSFLQRVSGGRSFRLGGYHRRQGPRSGCQEQGWLLLGEAARHLCSTVGWAMGHLQG